ncbi:hypothetical protein [Phenylobacterium sp.]|uniref:hypothetical protein n=1 Tax=Phenylobacterium sp. TaxID=1871053 RepID=UPI002CD83857|nr:hypothetical protein [Phenylobacterium sp.]HVI31975.1 hypothetical protein [Phenylobacterium sp.]
MKTLNTLALIGASALSLTAAAAAPAMAQPWNYPPAYDAPLTTSYVDSLHWRIDDAVRDGRMSPMEARRLHVELRRVQPLTWRVETGRASNMEFARLSRTVNRVEAAVNRYAAVPYAPPYAWGYRR